MSNLLLKRLKRKIQDITTRESQQDKKLQKNTEENKEVIITREESNYVYESFLVYVNNYEEIMRLTPFNDERKIIERDVSDIKILIMSSIDTHFLDSLKFFQQINHSKLALYCEQTGEIVQTEFVKTSSLFSPSNEEENLIYVLLSGSIGDYVGIINYFHKYHAGKRNKIISSIIQILDQLPLSYYDYRDLNRKYGLDLKGVKRGEKQVSEGDLHGQHIKENTPISEKEPDSFLIDVDLISYSLQLKDFDKRIKNILHRFLLEELETGEYNIIFYNSSVTFEEDCTSRIQKVNMIKLSYMIDYSKSNELVNQLKVIKREVENLADSDFHLFTYEQNYLVDDDENSEQINMYDLIDEIIK